VFGPDEDETGAAEVHEWMTAHRAESDDGSPAPCPHLDLVGTRRDMVANDPFTGGRFVPLDLRIPRHAATPLTPLSRPFTWDDQTRRARRVRCELGCSSRIV
jgi:hypothetical protein